MHPELKRLCDSLDGLAKEIDKVADESLKDVVGSTLFNDRLNGMLPYVNCYDLSNIAKVLGERVSLVNIDSLDNEYLEELSGMQIQIKKLKEKIVPSLFASMPSTVEEIDLEFFPHPVYVFINTMSTLEYLLEPVLGWYRTDKELIPKHLHIRLKGIKAQVDKIEPDYDDLKKKISTINEATETAYKLPSTLQDLEDAHKQLQELTENTAMLAKRVELADKEAQEKNQEVAFLSEEATSMLKQAAKALSASTSTALAQSFKDQAKSLKNSVMLWTLALCISLITILVVVSTRVQDLKPFLDILMKQNSTPWAALFVQSTVTFLLLAAPVWFAWVATKQIKQRFQLQQDYEFKAATATAYEGYHREAANLNDVDIEKRLFNAALTRLEEAPTRWLETDNHGSPMEGIIDSLGRANPFKNSQTQNKSNTKVVDKVNVTKKELVQEEEEAAV